MQFVVYIVDRSFSAFPDRRKLAVAALDLAEAKDGRETG